MTNTVLSFKGKENKVVSFFFPQRKTWYVLGSAKVATLSITVKLCKKVLKLSSASDSMWIKSDTDLRENK